MINRNNKYTSIDKKEILKLNKGKKKVLAVVGGILVTISLMSGCAKNNVIQQDTSIHWENELMRFEQNDIAVVIECENVEEIDFTSFSESITYILATRTNLNNLSEIANYKNIERLDLYDNLITDISALEELPNLLYLDISNNSISNINIEKFPKLTYLNIAGNYNLYDIELVNYCALHNIILDITKEDVLTVKKAKAHLLSLDLNDKSDIEKERIIYNYVVNHVEYDYNATQDKELLLEYNTHPLEHGLEGKGVCINYAVLFNAMCKLSGINCFTLSGVADNEPHGWDLVEIDGEYMLCDPTWEQDFLFGIRRNKHFNITGDKAKDFISNHSEAYTTYKYDNMYVTNIRNNMAIKSDENRLFASQDVLSKIDRFISNIDFSHINANDIYSKILLGLMAGQVILLSSSLKKAITNKIKQNKDIKEALAYRDNMLTEKDNDEAKTLK